MGLDRELLEQIPCICEAQVTSLSLEARQRSSIKHWDEEAKAAKAMETHISKQLAKVVTKLHNNKSELD